MSLLSGDELMIGHLSVVFLSGVGQPGLREVCVFALLSSGRLGSIFFLHCRAIRYCCNICDTYGVGEKVGSPMVRLAKLEVTHTPTLSGSLVVFWLLRG